MRVFTVVQDWNQLPPSTGPSHTPPRQLGKVQRNEHLQHSEHTVYRKSHLSLGIHKHTECCSTSTNCLFPACIHSDTSLLALFFCRAVSNERGGSVLWSQRECCRRAGDTGSKGGRRGDWEEGRERWGLCFLRTGAVTHRKFKKPLFVARVPNGKLACLWSVNNGAGIHTIGCNQRTQAAPKSAISSYWIECVCCVCVVFWDCFEGWGGWL